jgi:hypothetical protein
MRQMAECIRMGIPVQRIMNRASLPI